MNAEQASRQLGEERLEDVLDPLRRDAGPRILDAHRDKVAAYRGMAADGWDDRNGVHHDGEGALAVHGVTGVDGHVRQGGVELARIGVDEVRLGRNVRDDPDARAAQGANHVADGGDASAGSKTSGLSACRRAKAGN